ncbi:tRNA-dihydrouridine synthase family protein, partial [bacterium]|nr:tRNA-dihydrouridine synthase family protein [bacterium]
MFDINKPSYNEKLTKLEFIPLALAPLAGVTDLAFRTLCLEIGKIHKTILPMIGAKAILNPSSRKNTLDLIDISPLEVDAEVQIFGSDLQEMARAARVVADIGAKNININLGCQVPKIIKEGSGACLLKDHDKILRIIDTVSQILPVTLKIRLGWDKFDILPLIKRLEGWPILAIYVHGRIALQAFKGD